ncbi:MAG: hypothetical protein ACW96S_11985, partial [Promethearchaeota archaeon]
MKPKVKSAIFEIILFLSPIVASIIYWLEEPLNTGDLINDITHRTGSILGIFAFIWFCFNILSSTRIKLVEKNLSIDGLIGFHTHMPIVAFIMMIIHYPLVRIGREFSTLQIRSGSISVQIFTILLVFSLIFMSNRLLKFNFIKKLRLFSFRRKFRYKFHKMIHNLMMLGMIVAFIHTQVAFTSQASLAMRIV